MKQPKFNITREQAIKLICNITDQDDPFWENLVDEFYDEETDTMPTIYDVLKPIGITKDEIDAAEGVNKTMKFKKDIDLIVTDNFWYDLFTVGDIKPEEIIDDPSDLRILQNAISVVEEFQDQLEKQDLIEYI